MMIQTETALSQPILNSLPRPQLSESGRNPSPVQEAERPDLYNLRLINEVEPPELQEVEVPKVLGDVFEALIGAVYIDSGHCLHTVKRAPLRGRHEGAAQEPQEDATRALLCQVQPRRGEGDERACIGHCAADRHRP